jgi:ATP-dependent RNA helicase DeaD
VHFLSDVSGVERRHFGDVSLQQNCAFFDIAGAHDPGLATRFEGIEVEGRNIRVNRDDEGHKRSRPGYSKKGKGAYAKAGTKGYHRKGAAR